MLLLVLSQTFHAGDRMGVFGPVVIGNSVNWLLLGLLLAQLYTYCRRVQRDPSLLRTLVGAIVFFELAHTALLTYHGWWLWLILTESVYGRIKPWDVVNSSNYRARMLVDAACRRSRAIVLRIANLVPLTQ